MKTAYAVVLSLLASVTYALAGGGAESEGIGFMGAFFIALGVMIVLFQFIPGIMLLGGMLKGLFSHGEKKAPATGNNE